MIVDQPFFIWRMDVGNLVTMLAVGAPLIYVALKVYWTLSDYVPHKHTERKGPLHSENVVYPRPIKGHRGEA